MKKVKLWIATCSLLLLVVALPMTALADVGVPQGGGLQGAAQPAPPPPPPPPTDPMPILVLLGMLLFGG